MTANTEPIFTKTPRIGLGLSTGTGNTASDGSGSLADIFTAGTNGSRIERIRYSNAQLAAAASSALVLRFFITDTNGLNPKLLCEVSLPVATRTVAVVGAGGSYTFANGLVIPAGTKIQVGQSVYTGVQDLLHFVVEGGDY
jgi:hypothetical protein